MKNKDKKKRQSNHQDETQKIEPKNPGRLSIFNDSYPLFLGFDLVQHLPEIPYEKEPDNEKPSSFLDDPEALKVIEQFKAYSNKIKPPME
ncbi:hypothetical protein N8988_04300 [Opitutales bacterium]|nr:hypothetical protein [Opitutales bacterium]